MEENELLEIAAGKKRLVDFSMPFFGWTGLEVSREVDINMPARALSRTRGDAHEIALGNAFAHSLCAHSGTG
jgi:hypothetical protein